MCRSQGSRHGRTGRLSPAPGTPINLSRGSTGLGSHYAWVNRKLPITSQAKFCAVASGFFAVIVFIITGSLLSTPVAAVVAAGAAVPLVRFLRPVTQRDGQLVVPTAVGAFRLPLNQVAGVDVVAFRFGSFRGWVVEVEAHDGRRVKAWSTAEEDRPKAVAAQKRLLQDPQTA